MYRSPSISMGSANARLSLSAENCLAGSRYSLKSLNWREPRTQISLERKAFLSSESARFVESSVDAAIGQHQAFPTLAHEIGRRVFGYDALTAGIHCAQYVDRIEHVLCRRRRSQIEHVEQLRSVAAHRQVAIADVPQLVEFFGLPELFRFGHAR